MALFGKNPNETAYVGGKKHWTDVIKNSGSGELLIWRQPEEDFNTNSTLIVMPGEEAIFIKGGVIEQTFDNNTYKLSTENYPFISRLRNAFSGGISTFNCVVYFVRTAHSMEITWGTETPIQVRDPVMGIMTSVRAYGAYKVKIANASVFLTKLLGNNIPFLGQDELNAYLINEFQQYIKSSLAKAIKASNEEILGICAEQDILATQIQPILQEVLDAYGLQLITFSIANITIPENDPNRQMLEDSFARRGVRRQDAFGKREEQDILGISWGQREAAEILKDVANNPGAGGVASAGAGLGMGMAAGSVFGGMAQQLFYPMQQQTQQQMQQQPQQMASPSGRFTQKSASPVDGGNKCPACGADNTNGAKFCNECGSKLTAAKKYCNNCGAEVSSSAKFCNECGNRME